MSNVIRASQALLFVLFLVLALCGVAPHLLWITVLASSFLSLAYACTARVVREYAPSPTDEVKAVMGHFVDCFEAAGFVALVPLVAVLVLLAPLVISGGWLVGRAAFLFASGYRYGRNS